MGVPPRLRDKSDAGSGFAALIAISVPSQVSVPAPEEVHSNSTVSVGFTYRLPMSVAAPGAGGAGFAPRVAATMGLPPHSINGLWSAGNRTTTTLVVQTALASWSPWRGVGAGVVMRTSSFLRR
jgi:hypothetical protein